MTGTHSLFTQGIQYVEVTHLSSVALSSVLEVLYYMIALPERSEREQTLITRSLRSLFLVLENPLDVGSNLLAFFQRELRRI